MKLKERVFFSDVASPAITYAVQALKNLGCTIADSPSPRVTHLLLPVPCRLSTSALNEILTALPEDITVFGGFLDRPELIGYSCRDLLTDPLYLAQTAMITAHCAQQLGAAQLPIVWDGCPVLILGWGRIGKCLARLLQASGAQVTVTARRIADRAMCAALGYGTRDFTDSNSDLQRYRILYNTVPSPVLSRRQAEQCRPDCVMIELASRPGIDAPGVIDGRGLPGVMAPESSGSLIANTIFRICAEKEM